MGIPDSAGSKGRHGSVLYYEGTIEDITLRRKAEDALRESETLFRSLVETMLDPMVILAFDGMVRFTNPAAVHMLELPAGESAEGQPFNRFLEAESLQKALVDLQTIRQDGGPLTGEYCLLTYQGQSRWVEARGIRIGYLGEAVDLVTLRDITERKRSEEALQKSEEKYRNIFNDAILGIYQTTPDGRIVDANPALVKMYGYDTREELINNVTATQMYVNPEDREIFKEILSKEGVVEKFEVPFRKTPTSESGEILWVSINARVVKDEADKALYYEGTIEDITSRKHAEEEKARLESRLLQSQKMEAIGTLAGGIAHDFNNILTALMGYATLMQMKMDKGSSLRPYVDQVLAASRKASDLTKSLLAFSRHQPVTLTPLDMNETIKTTKKLLKSLLTEDIDLRTLLTKDDTTIMADRSQMDQVLFNLAANARDAMPHGGTLSISTDNVRIDDGFIKAHGFGTPGRYVLIGVSDTGAGMDETTKRKIFDPFFTTKGTGKGTGLGLATVYGIIKKHNGYITVDSMPSQGTVFRIYLPATETMKKTVRHRAAAAITVGKETILIAEDNEQVRRFMQEVLQQQGYTTIEASDGEDAIDKFKQCNTIDLVIIDLVMPKKNGREVYEELSKTHPHMKVLFTSGYSGDIVLEKGITAGDFDFIAKPLSFDTLLRKVRAVLKK